MKTRHSDHAGQDETTEMLRRELCAQLSLRGWLSHEGWDAFCADASAWPKREEQASA